MLSVESRVLSAAPSLWSAYSAGSNAWLAAGAPLVSNGHNSVSVFNIGTASAVSWRYIGLYNCDWSSIFTNGAFKDLPVNR